MTHADYTQNTQTSALPDAAPSEGWCVARLDDLLQPGGLFDGPFGSNLMTADYCASGVRVVRLENLSNLRFVEEKRTYISTQKYADLKKHTVVEGDILFGSFVEDSVRVCILPRLDTPAIAKADCFCIRPPTDLINRRYLVFQLANSSTRDALLEGIHGATRPRINTRQLRELSILLAPMAEQNRIAAQVEALLARVKEARERLDKVPAILKRFRQSVLAAACSGRLTEDWRTKQPELKPASELLEEIRRQRKERWVGKYIEPQGADVGELPTLPPGWCYATLDQLICEPLANGRSVPDAARGFPVLRLSALRSGRVILGERKIGAWSASQAKPFLVEEGDFFVARGNGSLKLVGRGGLVEEVPDPVAYPDTLIRIRVAQDFVLPTFLRRIWDSDLVRSQIETLAHTTAGIHKISQQDLRGCLVPLPPTQEQREIVRRVEASFQLSEEIERRVRAGTASTDKMTQAILAKAFRGELVPTEAELARREGREYEPASALLERVKHLRNAETLSATGDAASQGQKRLRRSRAQKTDTARHR